ncbi:SDR family NAD(P)-dependent oxidoreductase [Paenibacillus thalictri]|uniref:SDR family NAD(P)-dependent oxidoreductase n=1 Tax=Paenibacillus thalictri TaxID=2527873 RepID=UPI0013EF1F18|nr:SDR family oxidoreductase [Paenibacillus thalictri]
MSSAVSEFHNRTVIVTGGGKGIGAGIVRQFAQKGARIAIADKDPGSTEFASRLRQDGIDARSYVCDVSIGSEVERAVQEIARDFGRIDVLVNNAGIFPRGDLFSTDEALWERVMGINLKGVFLMCKAVVPHMAQDSEASGSIVNIGSLHSSKGEDVTLAYAVSKGGLITFTRNLAHALAPRRIRVNCVHPGWVASEGEVARWEANGSDIERIQQSAKSMPLGRMQTGDDIGQAAVFLSSDQAGQITGQMLAVDGGLSIRRPI